jgi:drug/metabolite transporter (DMT)-like permease
MNQVLTSVVAGLGAMLGWGTGDFFASKASRKIGNFRAFFWMQLVGLIIISVLCLVTPVNFSITPVNALLTVIAGVVFAVGYLFLYKGFEVGNVSVVSVTTNFWAVFTLLAGVLVFGEEFKGLQLPIILAILIGIILLSVNFEDFKKGKVSVLAGAKEGFMTALLHGAILWPLNDYLLQTTHWLFLNLILKFVAIVFILGMSLVGRKQIKLVGDENRTVPVIVLIGVLDVVAFLSFTLGINYGLTIIVAPIAAALSLVTVTLAVIFWKEKLKLNQILGILIVISGIILLSIL